MIDYKELAKRLEKNLKQSEMYCIMDFALITTDGTNVLITSNIESDEEIIDFIDEMNSVAKDKGLRITETKQ